MALSVLIVMGSDSDLDQITPACIRPVADPRDYFPSPETTA